MDNQLEVLNDLVRINNDRIEGYRKATEQLKEADGELLSLFNSYEQESRMNNEKLAQEINQLGGQTDDGTTAGGKIYRAWMDVKATFGGDDAKSVLESCERGEDAAKEAYKNAVNSGDLSGSSLSVVAAQQDAQRQAHDRIKSLRDQYKA